MSRLFIIGLGGFIGSVLRYLLSGAAQHLSKSASYPVGTLAVNVSGCFVIGLLAQLAESRGFLTDASRAFVIVGVLGGYTTFSTFGNETFNLVRSGESALGAANVVAHVLLGLLAVWAGRDAAHLIWR